MPTPASAASVLLWLSAQLPGRRLLGKVVENRFESCQIPVVDPARNEIVFNYEQTRYRQHDADIVSLPGFLSRVHNDVALTHLGQNFHVREGTVSAIHEWLEKIVYGSGADYWLPWLVVVTNFGMEKPARTGHVAAGQAETKFAHEFGMGGGHDELPETNVI